MVSVARLIQEMPNGYEEACYDKNAIQRKRGISDPNDLLMLSLFHLLNGCSLNEVSAIAKLTKLGNLSDVAFMKRFEKCNDWFKWIISNIVTDGIIKYDKPEWIKNYRVVAVDASDVTEKGRSNRIYRLHFAIDLFKMESLQYNITTNRTGETLCNFTMTPNDLYIADRVYGTVNGIEHCLSGESNFILRLRKNSFKIYNNDNIPVILLNHLRLLKDGEVLNLNAYIQGSNKRMIPIRVCAKRKTADAIIRTQKQIHRKESKKQFKTTDDTKDFNNYIILVTALPNEITSEQILELYRLRWQIELYFKRLKSIMNYGELPKRRSESVFAWLNGKIMIALLIEKILGKSDFSPQEK